MRFKVLLAFVAFSSLFISSPAHADDCGDALIAESCACRSGAALSTGKNGEHADHRTRSKASAIRKIAKAPVTGGSKGIAGAASVNR